MPETLDSPVLETDTATADSAAGSLRIAGAAFILLAAGFMTVIMLGAAMVPGYDFQGSAISDLGVAPETALLFNSSLVLVGLLNLIGGYYYYRVHGTRWLLGVFAVASLGAIGAGVFTLESAAGLHGLSALLAFLFFNLEAIGTAARLRGMLRWLSLALGILGLASVVVMALGDAGNTALFGPIGHGGTERMIVYPPMVWLIVFGGFLLGQQAPSISKAS